MPYCTVSSAWLGYLVVEGFLLQVGVKGGFDLQLEGGYGLGSASLEFRGLD